jgi:hypothetical protein
VRVAVSVRVYNDEVAVGSGVTVPLPLAEFVIRIVIVGV